jgi:hypothetical protein
VTKLTTHTPPQEVQDTAKKGLELAQKTGLVSSAHIRQIGQALANGEPHTKERLRHLLSYQRVHSQDATVRGWGSEENPSPAWISWLLYGGEAGRKWANKHVGKIDMTGPPEGYQHRDFLELVPEGPQPVPEGVPKPGSDDEYRRLLDLSDPRINVARRGAVPPSPFALKEPPTPGSEAEYQSLLSKSDPRLLWTKGR